MPMLEISDALDAKLKTATEEAIAAELERCAREFVDMTTYDDPLGQRKFLHTLTGRTLTISAGWKEE